MATGSEILSYTGNAGLGLGANPDISYNAGNLNQVNQAMRDVMLMDADQNNKIFQQKLKDRDSLYELLEKNQIQSGKILDKDRLGFDEAEKRQQQAFNNIRGINDSKGLEEFYKASNNLRNYTTQAQARYLGVTELQKEMASKVLPSQQDAYKRHIEAQESKPFWDEINPYQQALSLNLPSMYSVIGQNGMISGSGMQQPQTKTTDRVTTTTKNGKTSVTESQTTSPISARGASSVSRGTIQSSGGFPTSPITTSTSFYDFDVYKRNSNEAYLGNEEQQEYQNQWRQKWESLPPQTFIKNLDLVNDRIREYNQDRDLLPNQPGYVTEIEYTTDPQTGKPMIAESTPDFAAKTALASVDGPYVSRSQQFDKDIAKYLQDQQQIGIDWYKAKTARERADAYAKFMNARSKSDPASAASTQRYLQNWTAIADKVTMGGLSDSTGKLDAVFMDQLPPGFTYIGGVGKDKFGKKVTALELTPKVAKGGRRFYTVYYYDSNGNSLNRNSAELKNGYEESRKNGFRGNYDDFLKLNIKNGKLQFELEGANGRATAISAIESQRALNAEATAKGEENLFSQLPEEE